MKQKRQFRPQDLRTLLIFIFVIVILGGAGAFYVGLGILRDHATEVNHRLVDADASGKQVEGLQVLKAQLAQSSLLVTKADQLFSTQDTYRSRALSDIKNYADNAGLSIESTNFDDTRSQTVVVTLASPLSYKKLITFLANVESNLPKMQVSSLSLHHINGGSVDSVKVDQIKIDISVR